ncbi:IS66 family transposase [Colwellia chukchiensis]|uniref:IS66 family transposase n=1 Tax=Colwellia chukchiensis TaxID=641665 RepID=UPI003F5D0817
MDVVLNLIGKLYGIEATVKPKNADKKHQVRQEKSAVVFDKINTWAVNKTAKKPPKSKLGEALTYWHNQAHKRESYLKDGGSTWIIIVQSEQ